MQTPSSAGSATSAVIPVQPAPTSPVRSSSVGPDAHSPADKPRILVLDVLGVTFLLVFLLAGTVVVTVPQFRDEVIRLMHYLEHHQAVGGLLYTGVFGTS
jgi:hypothetical protein